MRFMQFASYLPMLAAINASESSFFRSISYHSGPQTYARSKSAARPENYRKRGIIRTGYREAERHRGQMAAGQLDFSASDPAIWRSRTYIPNWRRLTKRFRHVH